MSPSRYGKGNYQGNKNQNSFEILSYPTKNDHNQQNELQQMINNVRKGNDLQSR